jgi:hypothetical protein
MTRKVNFMKMVEAGAGHGMSQRSQKRAARAEAAKRAMQDLEGKSPGQAMALLKRKKRK